jgi:type VI secretion system secreted protein VgrG
MAQLRMLGMKKSADLKKTGLVLEGNFGASTVHFRAARITEGLSTVTEIRIEFLTTDSKFDVTALLGTRLRIEMQTDDGSRRFQGICIAVEFLGSSEGFELYGVDVRPWFWFLTRSSDNRIFQGKTAIEIFQNVCADHGFSDFKDRLSHSYGAREYCVQFNETDFDFLSRLMEEEGIYYYFDHSGDSEELILADGVGAHDPVGTFPFRAYDRTSMQEDGHIYEWSQRGRVVSGKISLVDYDMKKPNTDLKVASSIKKGKHSHGQYERYEVDGHYSEIQAGEDAARVRMEREAHDALRYICAANAPNLGAGATFKLTDEPKLGQDAEFLVVAATHHMQGTDATGPKRPIESQVSTPQLKFPHESGRYCATLEVAPKTEPYRPPRKAAWPRVLGVLTAVVTGPGGEEIYTDEYGRIKVQFHWDREGAKDEYSSCWVRTVVPWSGNGWGMFAIPRIGQEVVVEFENGNPDRPIVTGMVYNDATRHAVGFPDSKTISGLKTNSSKGGGGAHELVFEDKKDDEYVRMVSEKDYFLKIKNNAEITVGMEKKDKGDLTQTIYRHKTETLKTGDYTFTIEKGNRKVKISDNHAEDVGGTFDTKIKGNTSLKIARGNYSEVLDMGNFSTKLKMGNMSTKVDLGKIDTEAMQSIELKVGQSSIKIDQMGVTIKGMMIKIEGTAMTTVKAPMTNVKGDGLLVLKGGLTMIN